MPLTIIVTYKDTPFGVMFVSPGVYAYAGKARNPLNNRQPTVEFRRPCDTDPVPAAWDSRLPVNLALTGIVEVTIMVIVVQVPHPVLKGVTEPLMINYKPAYRVSRFKEPPH